jgi:hypothetical protein
MTDIPWEPPAAGTEIEHLLGALDRMRTTFRWKADGLDAAALNAKVGKSSLTLGGLLKHLALIEDHTLAAKVLGVPLTGWDDYDPDAEDWEFTSAAQEKPEDLYARFDDSVARFRGRLAEALADGGLDRPSAIAGFSLRRVLFDHLEEYARHCGQADILRDAIDGRAGEDPPADWRPASGHYTFR